MHTSQPPGEAFCLKPYAANVPPYIGGPVVAVVVAVVVVAATVVAVVVAAVSAVVAEDVVAVVIADVVVAVVAVDGNDVVVTFELQEDNITDAANIKLNTAPKMLCFI